MFDDMVFCCLCCLGKVVRELKAQGGDRSQVDLEGKKLLALKEQYKVVAGHEWASSAAGRGGTKKKEKGKVEKTPAEPKGETMLFSLGIVT